MHRVYESKRKQSVRCNKVDNIKKYIAMLLNMVKKYTSLIIIVMIISCQSTSTSIEECNCQRIKLYGSPNNISSPIRTPLDHILSQAPIIISEKETIDRLVSEIKNFDKEAMNNKIDNRFAIELECLKRANILIGSNNYSSRWKSTGFV